MIDNVTPFQRSRLQRLIERNGAGRVARELLALTRGEKLSEIPSADRDAAFDLLEELFDEPA